MLCLCLLCLIPVCPTLPASGTSFVPWDDTHDPAQANGKSRRSGATIGVWAFLPQGWSQSISLSSGSQLYKVGVHSCTKSGCSSTCTSHLPQSQFLTLKPFSSHCQMPHPLHGWLCPVRLCQIVAPSLRVLLPPKINSKALVISVVAGLGLTSLAFIRNTSLGLCWYKST